MRRAGQLLLALGLVLGVVTGASLWLPWHLTGFAWLLGVGMAKLCFAGSLGLMGVGASLQRLAARRPAEAPLLPAPMTPRDGS